MDFRKFFSKNHSTDDTQPQIVADCVTKFFKTVYVFGWFYKPGEQLAKITVRDSKKLAEDININIDHGGVQSLGKNLGWRVQIMRSTEEGLDDIELIFESSKGSVTNRTLGGLCKDRIGRYESPKLAQRFLEMINAMPNPSVLDIGGRARSGLLRRDDFSVPNYTVLDIVKDDGVDVVGDAHNLANIFPHDTFDAIQSVSVFEHLLMPWAVAVGMNKVMKNGGIALISTHQTLGLHDMPWDYWRFSSDAWDSLFNKHTGFEIIERIQDFEQFILPFVWRPQKNHAERSAGFELSSVLVKKVGPCSMDWSLTAADIVQSNYPTHKDDRQGRDIF